MRDPIPVYVHLRRAKDLIDRDFAEPLDVPPLPGRRTHRGRTSSAASRRPLARRLTNTLLRRRIERAKDLLRSTPLSVTEVSLEVGFRSLGSFSAAFRQLVGEPPSAYARRWRSADAPRIPACFTLMYTRPHQSTFREASTGEPS
jgi:transcriptional regulator GlxA family with amidase domain